MEEAEIWIKKADEDLRVSQKLFTLDKRIYNNIICFHCQQAVEKYLKSFLVFHNIEIPKTHDLAKLIKLCIKVNEEFKILRDNDIDNLTIYATDLRYPDFFAGDMSFEETKEAIEKAEFVKDFVMKKLKGV
jgi:HEPN domain-containing protein